MNIKPQTVVIIGGGPAGLSAAAHAAKLGLDHVLLEAQDHLADTIYKYQLGKHVMAEPGYLDLRSPLSFSAGLREDVLSAFDRETRACGARIQHNAKVTAISGEKGGFWITLENGELLRAEQIVLAIGLQGNLRTLGVPGENLPNVQCQLDNPHAYGGETIVVVGAGDAAIENALALAAFDCRVILLNRNEEFSRCKEGNLRAIQSAERDGRLGCRYRTSIDHIDPIEREEGELNHNRTMVVSVADLSKRQARKGAAPALRVVLNTPLGEEIVDCHRVIARLGAIPPRTLVEGFGVRFSSAAADALPQLSSAYESSVPGLYIVGALGGYPLIKQAMNQGYEAIESICGRKVVPADEPLLNHKFEAVIAASAKLHSVDDVLALVAGAIPWLDGLNALQLREFMLASDIRLPREGTLIFERNDYSNSFFSILRGEVLVRAADDPKTDGNIQLVRLGPGDFFGELGLISGRRRSASVSAGPRCILIETPRREMLKLLASVESVRRELDRVALHRAVRKYVAPRVTEQELNTLIEGSQIRKFKAGEVLFSEGDRSDGLYLIRKGSVMVSRTIGGREVVLSYVSAGNYVGEMALMLDAPRSATVRAAVPCEAIVLLANRVTDLLAQNTGIRGQLDDQYLSRIQANQAMAANQESGNLISFLLKQGVGEATDVLLIDESLCIRCDNCEKACADTHSGTSRLDREAGPTFDSLHVPTSCRHCEHPHCMKDCPPDAIHRSPGGEVYITDACIGCGNCEKNCPYGVIQMAPVTAKKGIDSLWAWLFLGLGREPGAAAPKLAVAATTRKSRMAAPQALKAVKCDMCKDLKSGPACVRACPTGAALRISPERFLAFSGNGE